MPRERSRGGAPRSLRPLAPALVAAGGAVTALGFPEPGLFPLVWIGLAPLLASARGCSARRGFALGLMWGLGFFGVLLYWISIVGFLAWILLVLLQSIFVAAFGSYLASSASQPARALWSVPVAAAGWVAIVELLRGSFPLGGFTWGQLAQSQTDFAPMMRLSSLAGGWGTAFVIVVVNGLLVLVWEHRRSPRHAATVGAAAVALLVLPGFVPAARPDDGRLRVAIVQGNIPRDMAPSAEKDRIILRSHVHLTSELREVDLVVWPESSVGFDPNRATEASLEIADAARAAGAPLLFGGDLDRDDGNRQVMAYLVAPDGDIVDAYQKTHLVPFGEYVPARSLLGGIPALQQVPRDAVPGTEGALFDISGVPVAPVISFEGDFGPLVRQRVADGGRIVVVTTNTSTWGDSWASAQHVAMTRLRAAENGVPVVHAALTGISAFISASGEIVDSSEMWVPAVLESDVVHPGAVTLYARMGDWLPWACAFASAVVLGMGIVSRRRITSEV